MGNEVKALGNYDDYDWVLQLQLFTTWCVAEIERMGDSEIKHYHARIGAAYERFMERYPTLESAYEEFRRTSVGEVVEQ